MLTSLLRTTASTAVAATLLLSNALLAQTASLVDNRVIIDNAPFYSIGAEDDLGGGNFALNHPGFIDIPYAIFDLGAATTVSSAFLTWNFGSLFGGSGPAQISLYVGSDADGVITTADRFSGLLVSTDTYAGGELRTWDITSLVNAALAIGPYVSARLDATADPATLNGYYGGNFLTPSLTFSTTAVPEPASAVLLVAGLGGLAVAARRRSARAS